MRRLSWNPNLLEQRMGRVHRYGQQKEVYIFNLVADNTREGQVLCKLFEKLDEIRRAVGSDKVFDVIGDTFYGKNLYRLILEAVAKARSMDDILKEIDIKVDKQYIARVKEALGESLATRYIDYTRIKEMAEKAKEYRLIPEYVEEFFKRAFKKAGGRFVIKKDGFITIDLVPYEIRFLGAVLVKPEISDMITNEEIEKIGMEIAIEYEKNQGRIPEDVSKENLGFDIRSKGKDERRYIEVKARKDEGPVALTPNEWFKAKRFKEQYWLYVVSNAVTKPALYLINNLAENLNIQEKVEVVRFIVPLEEWRKKNKEVILWKQ